jgi:hypothetical protein
MRELASPDPSDREALIEVFKKISEWTVTLGMALTHFLSE